MLMLTIQGGLKRHLSSGCVLQSAADHFVLSPYEMVLLVVYRKPDFIGRSSKHAKTCGYARMYTYAKFY